MLQALQAEGEDYADLIKRKYWMLVESTTQAESREQTLDLVNVELFNTSKPFPSAQAKQARDDCKFRSVTSFSFCQRHGR